MSKERIAAARTLRTVAEPLATASAEFGDKIAVGTSATMVVFLSQLGDISDFFPRLSIYCVSILVFVSLLCYLVARYKAMTAQVLEAISSAATAIPSSVEGPIDVGKFYDKTVELSVWPVKRRLAKKVKEIKDELQANAPSGKNEEKRIEPDETIVNASQKVTRWLALQILFMLLGALLLATTFRFEPTQPPMHPQSTQTVTAVTEEIASPSDTPLPQATPQPSAANQPSEALRNDPAPAKDVPPHTTADLVDAGKSNSQPALPPPTTATDDGQEEEEAGPAK